MYLNDDLEYNYSGLISNLSSLPLRHKSKTLWRASIGCADILGLRILIDSVLEVVLKSEICGVFQEPWFI